MIERAICEAVFRETVVACDPAARVRDALERVPVHGREIIGLAVGKAALAMARGAGPVSRGLVVTVPGDEARFRAAPAHEHHDPRVRPRARMPADWPADRPRLPEGWSLVFAGHPNPDETSLAAGEAALELVASATSDDVVLALISGGASALLEKPREGVTFDEFRARARAVMASGAPIHEINRVRSELSALKGGKLAARSAAPVVTLVVSDVIGDDPRVIGSGPTVRDDPRDHVEVIAPMASFGAEIVDALVARAIEARWLAQPIAEDVAAVADRLAREAGVVVAWGEPTVRVPDDHGIGGRAQQLALELARRLRGTDRTAFVAGSDGVDGPAARGAAGAFVDGATWDAIVAAKIDPDLALRRCDAGPALDAVGGLVVTGPTGINHADIVIVG